LVFGRGEERFFDSTSSKEVDVRLAQQVACRLPV
jgi:hypothetical protein